MAAHLSTMALVFGVTLVVSLVLTALVRRWAVARGLVDMPGEERRVHKVPVPRLGGLAMFAAFAVGIVVMFLAGAEDFNINGPFELVRNGRFEPYRIVITLVGAGIITAVMAVDDIRSLPAVTRLIWQVVAAVVVIVPGLIWPGGPNAGEPAGTVHFDQGAGVIAISVQSPFGGTIDLTSLSIVVPVIFTVFWIVGMTNTINWVDGLDGLAGGVSLVACIVMFVVTGVVLNQYTLAYLPLVLGAAILGFLPYNIHPARIFMGDSGAMFLGFTLAVISIIGGAKLAAALLVLGIPLLDAVYMIVYRLYRGRSPAAADRGHLHHRLLDMGLSQNQVVLVFYLLCAAFGVLALPGGPQGTIRLFGNDIPSGMLKLVALVVMVLVLTGLTLFIARRSFDKRGVGG